MTTARVLRQVGAALPADWWRPVNADRKDKPAPRRVQLVEGAAITATPRAMMGYICGMPLG